MYVCFTKDPYAFWGSPCAATRAGQVWLLSLLVLFWGSLLLLEGIISTSTKETHKSVQALVFHRNPGEGAIQYNTLYYNTIPYYILRTVWYNNTNTTTNNITITITIYIYIYTHLSLYIKMCIYIYIYIHIS